MASLFPTKRQKAIIVKNYETSAIDLNKKLDDGWLVKRIKSNREGFLVIIEKDN